MRKVVRMTAIDKAREIGREHGENAAAWWEQDALGGRASARTIRPNAERYLRMIKEGDPALYDEIPQPDLSGQWADGYTPQALYRECEVERGVIACWIGAHAFEDELCDEYEEAFRKAVETKVAEYCQAVLA